MGFLIVYFLEQLFLILYLNKYPNRSAIVVGIFASVVLTTISIQKTLLDSKNKSTKEYNNDLTVSYEVLLCEYNNIRKLKNYKK